MAESSKRESFGEIGRDEVRSCQTRSLFRFASKSYDFFPERRADPAARANVRAGARPWLIVIVRRKMTPTEIITFAETTFPKSVPRMTLRQGNAVDSYRSPNSPTEEEAKVPEDRYLEEFHWGIPHLDPVSWKHYLPFLISYSIRHMSDGRSLVVSGLLQSLRPPDREPPRLATITKEEERVIISVLELLGFDRTSAHQEEALQVLQEYWTPGATYRK